MLKPVPCADIFIIIFLLSFWPKYKVTYPLPTHGFNARKLSNICHNIHVMICCSSRLPIILFLEFQFLSRENCLVILSHKTLCNIFGLSASKVIGTSHILISIFFAVSINVFVLSFKKSEHHFTSLYTPPKEKKFSASSRTS